MRFLLMTVAVILCTVLQATWLGMINLPGQVKPDLILILVICYGLWHGYEKGAIFGLLAGLFVDLLSGNVIGIGAMVKLLAGFSAGLFEKTVFKDNMLLPALAAFIGTILFETINLIMLLLFNANYHFGLSFLVIMFPLAVYNGLLAPLIYWSLLQMEQFITKRA